MSENAWKVDFQRLYTRKRWNEPKNSYTSHFLDIFDRKYIEENNLVCDNAEKIRLSSVFTRFWRILSAWVWSTLVVQPGLGSWVIVH